MQRAVPNVLYRVVRPGLVAACVLVFFPATATAGPGAPAAVSVQTIPAVRSWSPEAGPGWRPGRGTRVVTDPDGPFTREATLLAADLGVPVSTGPPQQGDVVLTLDDDDSAGSEAYTLVSRGGQVEISGTQPAGVFYGTRTLLQMLRSSDGVQAGVVTDWPDRSQRGLNLDIARKYYSPRWIEDRLREMADLKLNELGLHLSDDQGLRIESSTHPELVSQPHLTKAEMRHILAVADSLHITVIPEIDSPGHLRALVRTYPSLQVHDIHGQLMNGAVDIADPRAGRIVDDLLREYAPLFPGPYWHLGGDEYSPLTYADPEASFPRLAAAARKEFGPDGRIQDLATKWLNDRAAVVRAYGKRPRAWNDGFFKGGLVYPDDDIDVEYWTGSRSNVRMPEDYIREGRQVIDLDSAMLYYVLGKPGHFRYPTGQLIYQDWSPAVLHGTQAVRSVPTGPEEVLGARLAVWSDWPEAQSEQQVAQGIRLPLRAIAQRLWNPGRPTLSWPGFVALANTLDRR